MYTLLFIGNCLKFNAKCVADSIFHTVSLTVKLLT